MAGTALPEDEYNILLGRRKECICIECPYCLKDEISLGCQACHSPVTDKNGCESCSQK